MRHWLIFIVPPFSGANMPVPIEPQRAPDPSETINLDESGGSDVDQSTHVDDSDSDQQDELQRTMNELQLDGHKVNLHIIF